MLVLSSLAEMKVLDLLPFVLLFQVKLVEHFLFLLLLASNAFLNVLVVHEFPFLYKYASDTPAYIQHTEVNAEQSVSHGVVTFAGS